MLEPVDPKKTIQQLEEETLEFWKQNKIFEKSVDLRSKDNPFSFIDGPPFVSGEPHYGHLLTSVAKDVIPRYQTMKGKRVKRVWGWDCHGLPIEAKVNKKLGIKSSKEMEETLGIQKYIEECRKYVQNVSDDWKWYVERIGRWVDIENAYYTMNVEFMESVIWAFKQMHDKGHIYKGKRVSLYSTDTQTPVSQFEVAMDADNYQDVEDLSIFTKFKLKKNSLFVDHDLQNKPIYIIAWTTTPWTIPANFALAVNENADYVLVEYEQQYLILAKSRLEYTFKINSDHIGIEADKVVRILTEFKGSELKGLEYEPIYDYFISQKTENDFKIYLSSDVATDEGSGVLHIAPAYGEVDFNFGMQYGLSSHSDIDVEGKMTVEPWKGIYLRDASPIIAEDLSQKGNLLRSELYTHRLPMYRGDNPLIYMAQDSYQINIQAIKERMLELNENINWIPENVKYNRFANTIKTSPDWSISRSRYWATIMPIWRAENGEEIIVGSIEEMMQYSDQISKKEVDGKVKYFFKDQPMDLHRDIADQIIFHKDGKEYHRIPEVLDVWMDSGSVPFAEYHYPFEHKEEFEAAFPADYIIEYVPQSRAWFNVLHRISTMLFDQNSFTNVICHGTIGGDDGRKMSKSYGNYPDPRNSLTTYGADSLRLYLMSNPILLGEDMSISEEDWADQTKSVLNILYNSYKYFLTYASVNNYAPSISLKASEEILTKLSNLLNQWIIIRLNQTISQIDQGLSTYNIPQATRAIRPFIDDLSTWFIRRSRNKFVTGEQETFETMYFVLTEFCKAAAPIIPFITENIFKNLTDQESVHLADFPNYKEITELDQELLSKMELVRKISSIGLAIRQEIKQPIKQPLAKLQFQLTNSDLILEQNYLDIIAEELNIKIVEQVIKLDQTLQIAENQDQDLQIAIDTNITEDLAVEGKIREVTRAIQDVRKQLGLQVSDEISLTWYSDDPKIVQVFAKFHEQIKQGIKAKEIIKAENSDNLEKLTKENLFVKIN